MLALRSTLADIFAVKSYRGWNLLVVENGNGTMISSYWDNSPEVARAIATFHEEENPFEGKCIVRNYGSIYNWRMMPMDAAIKSYEKIVAFAVKGNEFVFGQEWMSDCLTISPCIRPDVESQESWIASIIERAYQDVQNYNDIRDYSAGWNREARYASEGLYWYVRQSRGYNGKSARAFYHLR